MCGSVFPDRNARVGSADLHIQMRISDRVSYLLICAANSKHRKRTCKRNFSRCSESCRNPHHIFLRDTTVDKAVRVNLLELTASCRLCQIRIEHDDIFMFRSELHQFFTITISRRNSLYIWHNASPSFSSSAIAILYSSSFGAFPCQPALFSMNETPFPFTVLAMIAVGHPFTVFASLNAASIWSKSFPSILITWKLNASNFLSIGYGEFTLSTGPSI